MMRKFVGLDGIKGLALVAIVAYHCTQGRLPGGFYGVDVFFTVAGFVMAASMFRKLFRKGKLNYVRYAQRRLARLYPALLLAVTAMVTFAGLFDRDALVNISGQVLSSLTGWYNWHAIIGGQSYFDQLTPQLLRHLWFVGVLLQFYVVLPFVVWVMWRLRATRFSVAVPLILATVSGTLMWVLYQPGGDPTRVYFGTDTHSTGLMLGVAFAWCVCTYEYNHYRPVSQPVNASANLTSPARQTAQSMQPLPAAQSHLQPPQPPSGMSVAVAPALGFIALMMLCTLCFCGKQDDFAFRGGIILASICSVVLIAGTISVNSWMRDLMLFKPLAALGRHSYGVYLWHWPIWIIVSAVLGKGNPRNNGWVLAVTLVLTALCSAISWYLLEQPIARHSTSYAIFPYPVSPEENKILQILRAVLVDVLVVVAMIGCVRAINDAPGKTQMQIQLEQQSHKLERGRKQTQGGQPAKPVQPAKPEQAKPAEQKSAGKVQPKHPKHVAPTGNQMTAIGDSVMLASADGLGAVFPGIDINAEVSRSMAVASQIAQADAAANNLRQWVVVGLSTNGYVTVEQLDQLRQQLGDDRVMVLVNAHGDRAWIGVNNQMFADYVNSHAGNTVLVDWDAMANQHLDQISSGDGIHPVIGSDIYAQAVKQAIDGWIAAGH